MVKVDNLDNYTREGAYAIGVTVGRAWEDRQVILKERRLIKLRELIQNRKLIKEGC